MTRKLILETYNHEMFVLLQQSCACSQFKHKRGKKHIIHYESYGIIILKKHVDGDHVIIVKNLSKS
jgi:hypothetical protein